MKLSFWNFILYTLALIGLFFILSYFAIIFDFTNTPSSTDLNRILKNNENIEENHPDAPEPNNKSNENTQDWQKMDEFQTFKKAVIKEKEKIISASNVVGVNPRLIVSILFVEQMRLYTDNSREFFKKVFEPLSILGIQSQYSWGVMGLKQETLIEIEQNLKNPNSFYYLGDNYKDLLSFSTSEIDNERFERIINEENQYYSYLYTAIYIKQILSYWEKSGFPINQKPEIIATLYNIGFKNSIPKADPKSGGSLIILNNKEYNFGELAKSFYLSNELIDEFPSN